jgi:hypothetical protein
MVSTTVMVRPPGSTVRWVLSETRLVTVTFTVTQEPADRSDPEDGDAVTLAGTWITKSSTGPPTAVKMNVPVAALPLTAVSTSLVGDAVKVPWLGGGDGDGDGDGNGEGAGEGDDPDEDGAGLDGFPADLP